MTQQTLRQYKPGDEVTLRSLAVALDPEVAERLRALGFIPGTRIQVLRRAPLGDPVEYALRGTRVSLRAQEARHVLVDPVEAP